MEGIKSGLDDARITVIDKTSTELNAYYRFRRPRPRLGRGSRTRHLHQPFAACDALRMLANMSVPESEVLKPLDASNTNSDDWEIFVLKDAHITYESNGKPASLLTAYADTPLKVEGHLKMPGRSQLKYRT